MLTLSQSLTQDKDSVEKHQESTGKLILPNFHGHQETPGFTSSAPANQKPRAVQPGSSPQRGEPKTSLQPRQSSMGEKTKPRSTGTTLGGTIPCCPEHPDCSKSCRKATLDTPHQTKEGGRKRKQDMETESPAQRRLAQAKVCLFLSLVVTGLSSIEAASNPHNSKEYMWTLSLTRSGASLQQIVSQTSKEAPVFKVDLCQLMNKDWKVVSRGGCTTHEGKEILAYTPIYGCPRTFGTSTYLPTCGTYEDYYCAKWGCETIAGWLPASQKDRLITVSRISSTTTIQIAVLQPNSFVWQGGKTWGLRLWTYGHNPGAEITIQKTEMPRPKISVGPLNQVPVIAPRARPTLTRPPPTTSGPTPPPNTAKISDLDVPKIEEKPVLKTLDIMFSFLNHTNPNATNGP
ncbi:MLV-related proviral Env polyprotein-like [Echinops telfairi]|uniref:MLV-related proviral Env polyprotein-like n=1 Tax=Echinops telfairi TaxID=9371 RepID=A0AC55CIQ9_ECHTE|nr:MLV-related proviral Env polyprotein-like [Echinops telfairi]